MSASPIRTFFGWILMAVGGLIALTCGLCTVAGVTIGLHQRRTDPHNIISATALVQMSLVFGGAALGGIGLFVGGLQLTKKPRTGGDHGR